MQLQTILMAMEKSIDLSYTLLFLVIFWWATIFKVKLYVHNRHALAQTMLRLYGKEMADNKRCTRKWLQNKRKAENIAVWFFFLVLRDIWKEMAVQYNKLVPPPGNPLYNVSDQSLSRRWDRNVDLRNEFFDMVRNNFERRAKIRETSPLSSDPRRAG